MADLKKYVYKLPKGENLVFEFVPASEDVYDKFVDDQMRGGSLSAARSKLVKACVRSHTGAQLDEIFESLPAVKHGMAMAVLTEAGATLEWEEGEADAS